MADSKQGYLLLLPPIASAASFQHLKAIYGPPLTVVFSDLLSSVPKSTLIDVDIALACPYLCGTQLVSRSKLFDRTQADLATLYRLICVLLIELDDPDEAERIDARVILLRYANDTPFGGIDCSSDKRFFHGPVFDLSSLAQSKRQWKSIFSLKNKDGDGMAETFLHFQRNAIVDRIESESLQLCEENYVQPPISEVARRHVSVAVGGTFDHLHIGHKLLLTMTAFLLDNPENKKCKEEQVMTIGITGNELLRNKKYAEVLEPWQSRQQEIANFLQSILCLQSSAGFCRAEGDISREDLSGLAVYVKLSESLTLRCVELKDPYGPPIHDEAISALVVSAETKSGAEAINSKRIQKGWVPLDVYQVKIIEPLHQAKDGESNADEANDKFQGKISSTEIRRRISARNSRIS